MRLPLAQSYLIFFVSHIYGHNIFLGWLSFRFLELLKHLSYVEYLVHIRRASMPLKYSSFVHNSPFMMTHLLSKRREPLNPRAKNMKKALEKVININAHVSRLFLKALCLVQIYWLNNICDKKYTRCRCRWCRYDIEGKMLHQSPLYPAFGWLPHTLITSYAGCVVFHKRSENIWYSHSIILKDTLCWNGPWLIYYIPLRNSKGRDYWKWKNKISKPT